MGKFWEWLKKDLGNVYPESLNLVQDLENGDVDFEVVNKDWYGPKAVHYRRRGKKVGVRWISKTEWEGRKQIGKDSKELVRKDTRTGVQ